MSTTTQQVDRFGVLDPDVRFVQFTLVTDTEVFEVVARTAKTVTIRRTKRGERIGSHHVDGNPYPLVYTEAVAFTEAEAAEYAAYEPQYGVQEPLDRVVRLRKDGTFRVARWANPLRPATVIDGKAVTFTDYRY